MIKLVSNSIGVFVAVSLLAVSFALGGLDKGATIEVKQGDDWVNATVRRTDIGRVLVQHEDGGLEWVTADRLHPDDAAQLPAPPSDKPVDAAGAGEAGGAAAGGGAPMGGGAATKTIQVREGDTWSSVTVLQNQGGKLQVRYDDGTLEWVGPDRLHPADAALLLPSGATGNGAPASDGSATIAGSGTSAGSTLSASSGDSSAGGDSSAPGASAPPHRAQWQYFVGDQVEVKRGGSWNAAVVKQTAGGWVLVKQTGDSADLLWAEVWALRLQGSSYDFQGDGTNSWPCQPGQVAPDHKPDFPPQGIGNPLVVGATAGPKLIVGKDVLEKQVDPISFDGSHEPAGGGAPLHLSPPSPSGEFAAWALRGSENRIDAIFPAGMQTVVASFPGSFGKWGAIIRSNVATRGQLDTRVIRVSDLKVVSASEGGDVLLSLFNGDKNLQVWKWTAGNYQLAENLCFDNQSKIVSATLIGSDRAVIAAEDGMNQPGFEPHRLRRTGLERAQMGQDATVCLVDLPGKRVISSVKAAAGSRVFVHPSGEAVGVVTTSSTALILRAEDFSVVQEFDDASGSNVTIDASGQFAAFLTSAGVVRVVKMADGSQIGKVAVGSNFTGAIDLVDDKFLLVDHQTAYDIKSGVPVWIYKMPNDAIVNPLANGQFLIAAQPQFGKTAAVAVASIPDHVGRAALAEASPDKFIWKPGTSVKVDGDYGAFGDDKNKASDAVNQILTGMGMVMTDQDTAFHLTVGVAGGPSEKRDYAPGMFAGMMFAGGMNRTTVDVPSNIFTATLMYKGTPVWTQQITFQAGWSISKRADQSDQDVVNEQAKPVAYRLGELTIPAYLPVGAKLGTPAALGVSDLADRRFVPEQPAPTAPN